MGLTPARALAASASSAPTNRPEYDKARTALETLHRELEDRNQSAAGSLAEGLDETLTLHRLGLYGVLGRSLKTTNCLESINALVEERCAKVDHWQNSSQRHRWLATALLDIEPRLRKVMGYRHPGAAGGGGGSGGGLLEQPAAPRPTAAQTLTASSTRHTDPIVLS